MASRATRKSSSERLPLMLAAVVVAGGLVLVIGSMLQRDSGEMGGTPTTANGNSDPGTIPAVTPPEPTPRSPGASEAELRRLLGETKLHLARNDLTAAKVSLGKAADVDSQAWQVHMLHGVVAAKENRHDEALGHYARAEKMAPREPDLAQSQGVSLRRLGRLEDAHALFSKALAWDPDFAEAYLQRGLIDAHHDKFAEAAEDFTRFIELRPENPIGYQNRAAALAALGKENESRVDQMKAKELQAMQLER